jgi:hypothetical protein
MERGGGGGGGVGYRGWQGGYCLTGTDKFTRYEHHSLVHHTHSAKGDAIGTVGIQSETTPFNSESQSGRSRSSMMVMTRTSGPGWLARLGVMHSQKVGKK